MYLRTITFVLVAAVSATTQEDPERTRAIMAEEFVHARPEQTRSRRTKPSNARPSVSGLRPARPTQQIGLTIWRLRPARDTDDGVRILIHEDGADRNWVPERVSARTPMRERDRVRLTFESAREGYLYVVDREQYADKTMGEPYLIFPTRRTRNGDNRVTPGRLIEIPAQDDRPNYLTLRTSRADQTGEQLSLIISPQPLEDVVIGSNAIRLPIGQFRQWEQRWGAATQAFEFANHVGKVWTRAEQEAGADATRLLTQEDPGPQTIYTVAGRENAPVLVTVQLQYARSR